MNKRSARKDKGSRSDPTEAAKRKAGEAAKAKELSTAIEGKRKQGKSSLGPVPADDDKSN